MSGTINRIGCLTCGSKNWLRRHGRMLTGRERLYLQGYHTLGHHEQLEQFSDSLICTLAGNAVNYFNMAQGLVAAFSGLDIAWS